MLQWKRGNNVKKSGTKKENVLKTYTEILAVYEVSFSIKMKQNKFNV